MNILHVITHYDPVIYGAENFAKHVAEYQASDKNNIVWVVTGWWDSSWKGEEIINGVNVVRVKCPKIRYVQTLLATIPLYFKASEIIKRNKVDVVHTHIYPGMLVGYLLSRRLSIPYLATIQGGDIGDYDEVFGPFKGIAKKLIGFCLSRAKQAHCVSTYLAREVGKMGVEKRKITVIPNGVDITKFKNPSCASLPTSRDRASKGKQSLKLKYQYQAIKLISTSRLEKKNNLLSLVEVLSKLRSKGYKLQLDIYGTGSLEKKLREQVDILQLNEVVNIRGYITQDELSQALNSYDLFVRLSTQEGFGISFVEAMASGVVPVGTPAGGIVDIIDNDQNGYLVDLQSDLSEQFVRILKDHDSWDAKRKAARIKVETTFDWKVILPEVNKLYE